MDRIDRASIETLRGPKGEKGDPGTGLTLRGVLANADLLPPYAVNGDAWLIAGDVWVGVDGLWLNAGRIQGPPGPEGPRGIQGTPGGDGPEGPPGPMGQGIALAGVLGTPEQLPLTANPGEAYLINGELYAFGGTAWSNLGPVQGPRGPVGPEGPPGVAGADGPAGANGAPGQKGDTGAVGPVGPVGPEGPQGPVGPQGAPGDPLQLAGNGTATTASRSDHHHDLRYAGLLHQHPFTEVTGTASAGQIPALDAAKIGSGVLALDRLPTINAERITTGTLNPARIPDLDAARIATGKLAVERLPVGATATTVAVGDHRHTRMDAAFGVNRKVTTSDQLLRVGPAHEHAAIGGVVALNTEMSMTNWQVGGWNFVLMDGRGTGWFRPEWTTIL